MPTRSKYTVQIPVKDNLGQPLKDIATAAHHYLHNGPIKNVGSKIYRNVEGNWRDDPQERFDDLILVVDDTPEMDSAVKQLAVHIADVANQWGVYVTKEGKNGIQDWVMPPPQFRKGEGADPAMLKDVPEEPQEPAQGVSNPQTSPGPSLVQ
jgi:hypothetical protein